MRLRVSSKRNQCAYVISMFNQNMFNIEFSITENRCAYAVPHVYPPAAHPLTRLLAVARSIRWLVMCTYEVHGHDGINANTVMTVHYLSTYTPRKKRSQHEPISNKQHIILAARKSFACGKFVRILFSFLHLHGFHTHSLVHGNVSHHHPCLDCDFFAAAVAALLPMHQFRLSYIKSMCFYIHKAISDPINKLPVFVELIFQNGSVYSPEFNHLLNAMYIISQQH